MGSLKLHPAKIIKSLSAPERPRQRKAETGTTSCAFRFNPYPAAVHFHDPFDQRQPKAASFGAGIQLVEQTENIFLVPRVYPHAIVTHKEDCFPRILIESDVNTWLCLPSHVLYGVFHQVLPDYYQT